MAIGQDLWNRDVAAESIRPRAMGGQERLLRSVVADAHREAETDPSCQAFRRPGKSRCWTSPDRHTGVWSGMCRISSSIDMTANNSRACCSQYRPPASTPMAGSPQSVCLHVGAMEIKARPLNP
jgi:hypothetical protein